MNNYKFRIIYGEYQGLEKKAIDFVSRGVSEYINYALPATKADKITDELLKETNLIIIGTTESNALLKKLSDDGIYKNADKEEGFSIKVTKSAFDESAQMIIISGYDSHGVMYGAAEFSQYFIGDTEVTYVNMFFLRNGFTTGELPEYEYISSPSIKQRGLWTWGHVIYDYRKYIRNMAQLKMNTLIVWNDFEPINIEDIIKEAHDYGIRIYLGFSWGWNEARKENGGLDISNEETLTKIQDIIISKYRNDYARLDIDGIYFQSFTETKDDSINNVVIAERVVKLVNQTAAELYKTNPDLLLMFGLHATSVTEKLEYIAKTDERIMIVWEDCGAFPYNYIPEKIENYDETCELSKKIAVLRGKNDNFGVVTKGLICLDWETFKHIRDRFVMGEQSERFIKNRLVEKKKFWNYINSHWLNNADYAYNMVKLLKNANENTLITALVEDGMFEEQIFFAAALYAEMLWDTEKTSQELIRKVSIRKDVEF